MHKSPSHCNKPCCALKGLSTAIQYTERVQKGCSWRRKGEKIMNHRCLVTGGTIPFLPPYLPTFLCWAVRTESYSRHMAPNLNCSAVTHFPTTSLLWLPHHLSEVAFWIEAHGAAWETRWEEQRGTPLAFLAVCE